MPRRDFGAKAHHRLEDGSATVPITKPYVTSGELRQDARCVGAACGSAINPDHRGIVFPVAPVRGANAKQAAGTIGFSTKQRTFAFCGSTLRSRPNAADPAQRWPDLDRR